MMPYSHRPATILITIDVRKILPWLIFRYITSIDIFTFRPNIVFIATLILLRLYWCQYWLFLHFPLAIFTFSFLHLQQSERKQLLIFMSIVRTCWWCWYCFHIVLRKRYYDMISISSIILIDYFSDTFTLFTIIICRTYIADVSRQIAISTLTNMLSLRLPLLHRFHWPLARLLYWLISHISSPKMITLLH